MLATTPVVERYVLSNGQPHPTKMPSSQWLHGSWLLKRNSYAGVFGSMTTMKVPNSLLTGMITHQKASKSNQSFTLRITHHLLHQLYTSLWPPQKPIPWRYENGSPSFQKNGSSMRINNWHKEKSSVPLRCFNPMTLDSENGNKGPENCAIFHVYFIHAT